MVIDGDVLTDLRRSEFVDYTVINGRVFEAATMNEVGSKKKRQPFFFEQDNQSYMPKESHAAIDEKGKRHNWVHYLPSLKTKQAPLGAFLMFSRQFQQL